MKKGDAQQKRSVPRPYVVPPMNHILPVALEALPEYLENMKGEEFVRCWNAIVIDSIQAAGECTIVQLDRTLVAARDKFNRIQQGA